MPTVEILKKRVGSSGNYTTIKVTSEIALDDSAEFRKIQARMNQLLDEELTKDQPRRFIQMDPAPQVQTRNSNEKTASEKQVRDYFTGTTQPNGSSSLPHWIPVMVS